MNNPTTFAVVASCMSNNGARAKSLGRVDTREQADALLGRAEWRPLGLGAEWSRTIEVFEVREMGRKVVASRHLD